MNREEFFKMIKIIGKGATAGQFVLGQNYPNPFTNQTAISFSLIEPSLVWLDVYSATGRKIAQLLNAEMKAGEHIIEWSRLCQGQFLAAGNYPYQLNVENSKGLYKDIKIMTIF